MAVSRTLVFLAVAWMMVVRSTAGAQTPATDLTSTVFRRFADQVIKIHVVETSSAATAELGSGFFVTGDGHIVTNYHVISKLVHEPTRYRAEWVEAGGATHPLKILAVDVVRDLAVLHAEHRPPKFFSLAGIAEPQGTRLYSLGHPNDLGLSIVEGTYNGLLQYTLYPKIHFTGALNPGMSGGPTITEDGRVVGINVSTEGNEISFLVPVERAAALLEKTRSPGYVSPTDELAEVGAQVRAYQDVYLDKLFGDSTPTVALGPFKVPTRPASFFKCWADATRSTSERPYEVVSHQCSTDDYIFLSEDQSTGVAELRHRLYTSNGLNALRFYSLYEARFASGASEMEGSETDVTRFECQTRNVRTGGRAPTTVRAVMCVRRYKKLRGLYDAMLRVAVLGHANSGLISTLTLSGVSFENAERITRRYLERIQ